MLKKGDVIRIPAGVPHKARTFEKEPMEAIIVYSSGDRQFEVDRRVASRNSVWYSCTIVQAGFS